MAAFDPPPPEAFLNTPENYASPEAIQQARQLSTALALRSKGKGESNQIPINHLTWAGGVSNILNALADRYEAKRGMARAGALQQQHDLPSETPPPTESSDEGDQTTPIESTGPGVKKKSDESISLPTRGTQVASLDPTAGIPATDRAQQVQRLQRGSRNVDEFISNLAALDKQYASLGKQQIEEPGEESTPKLPSEAFNPETPDQEAPGQKYAQAGTPPAQPGVVNTQKMELWRQRVDRDLASRGYNAEDRQKYITNMLKTWGAINIPKRDVNEYGQLVTTPYGGVPQYSPDTLPNAPGRIPKEGEMPGTEIKRRGGQQYYDVAPEPGTEPTPPPSKKPPIQGQNDEETGTPPPMTVTKQSSPPPAAQPAAPQEPKAVQTAQNQQTSQTDLPYVSTPQGAGTTNPSTKTIDQYIADAMRMPDPRAKIGPRYFEDKKKIQTNEQATAREYAGTMKQMDVAGQQASQLKDSISNLKKIISNPALPMGAWAPTDIEARRMLVALQDRYGVKLFSKDQIDKAADSVTLNDMFKKITSGGVLQSARTFLPPGSGQLRIYEIKLIQDAWPQITQSKPAAMFVADMIERLNNRTLLENEMARKYAATTGNLDAKFMTQLSKFQNEHPLYSDADKAKLEKLGTGAEERIPQEGKPFEWTNPLKQLFPSVWNEKPGAQPQNGDERPVQGGTAVFNNGRWEMKK